MSEEYDPEVSLLIGQMRAVSKHLSRQSRDAAMRLGYAERIRDQCRNGAWCSVVKCSLTVGCYYYIRRVYPLLGDGYNEMPCYAEWTSTGWNVLWGGLNDTPPKGADLEVLERDPR